MKKYKIAKDKNGVRYVNIIGRGYIPMDMAALGAGPDAWLRDVECKCEYCRKTTKISSTDIAGVCEECYEEMQNEIIEMNK